MVITKRYYPLKEKDTLSDVIEKVNADMNNIIAVINRLGYSPAKMGSDFSKTIYTTTVELSESGYSHVSKRILVSDFPSIINLLTINADYTLTKIGFKVNAVFDAGTISVKDMASHTFTTNSLIELSELGYSETPYWQEYNEDTTIAIELTGAPSTGELIVVLEFKKTVNL